MLRPYRSRSVSSPALLPSLLSLPFSAFNFRCAFALAASVESNSLHALRNSQRQYIAAGPPGAGCQQINHLTLDIPVALGQRLFHGGTATAGLCRRVFLPLLVSRFYWFRNRVDNPTSVLRYG